MENFFNVDHFPHNLGLANIPRNTVQHECVDVRLKFMGFHSRIDCLSPKLHGDIVRDELAFARVFKERFADFRTGVDGAKYIATRAMIKAWDRAERLALCTFAAARRAKKDEGIVSHERMGLYRKRNRLDKHCHPERNLGTRDAMNRDSTGSFDPESVRGSRRRGNHGIDVYPSPGPVEAHASINQGKNCVIAAESDIFSR